MPPRIPLYEQKKVPKPKNVGDVPRYLKELLGGFFKRFFYVVRLVWRTGHWILFLLAFMAVFKGVTPVIGSHLSKEILNALQAVVVRGPLEESAFWGSAVMELLVFLFVYRVMLQVINHTSTALNRIAGEKVVREVKVQMMQKSKEVDLSSFDNPLFYEKMENANREAGNRPLNILSETFSIVSTAIELASYLAILLAAPGLSWMTWIIVLVSIPSAIINFVYRRKNFRYMRHRSKERRQMNYYAQTLVNKDLVKEVRMFDLSDTFIERFTKVFEVYYKGLRRLIITERFWHVAMQVLIRGLNFMFYCIIAIRVFTGEYMLGDYTFYTGAILTVSNCVSTLINTSATVYEGTLFIDNLIDFMEEKQHILSRVSPALLPQRGIGHSIEFRGVSFRYPGTERYVLKNINLLIRPGETVVLVGLNGAGKTTLIKLLTRLYDPTEGEILLDGRDIRDYDVKSLYHLFGIIFQDFGKYAFSVEENIRFGDYHRPADLERVKESARQSAAEAFIEKLPRGYDTPLMRYFEMDGIEPSIGQWQKIAVARAFYADSDVMILDEPTASLDPMAEQEIFNQFDRLRSDKTTIFVSHRLSSATVADQIIVLEDGAVVENGSHRDLMELGGKYYTLFSTQAKRYLEEEGAPRERRAPREKRGEQRRRRGYGEPCEEGFSSEEL